MYSNVSVGTWTRGREVAKPSNNPKKERSIYGYIYIYIYTRVYNLAGGSVRYRIQVSSPLVTAIPPNSRLVFLHKHVFSFDELQYTTGFGDGTTALDSTFSSIYPCHSATLTSFGTATYCNSVPDSNPSSAVPGHWDRCLPSFTSLASSIFARFPRNFGFQGNHFFPRLRR